MAQKAGIPKGTRDFSATEVAKRTYVFDTIRSVFKNFGFTPIETPSFENLSTLMGKYGEEGDRLIFKILNSGDYLAKANSDILKTKDSQALTSEISEKALRYDLTVPFARYVVQHQNDLVFPFKRYQIQPVWRADRPQKGRFREFYQCDADVVGSVSLWQEVAFIQLFDEVFSRLKLKNTLIKINNRKILAGIAEVTGEKEKLTAFTTALDKLDKIGEEAVKNEMLNKGISSQALEKITPLFNLQGGNREKLLQLKRFLQNSEEGIRGVEEVDFILKAVEELGLKTAVLELDISLARGLNYYTGAIFEVKDPVVETGSIGGGGRYDDLTSVFGLKGISGVGISFGLDRICMLLETLKLFPKTRSENVQLMFTNFGDEEALRCMKTIKKLREHTVNTELYPDVIKLKKQLTYAAKKQIPYVVIAGSNEIKMGQYMLKDMQSGDQKNITEEALIEWFASKTEAENS